MATIQALGSQEMIKAMRDALSDRENDINRGYASVQTAARDMLFFTMAINTGLRPSDLRTLPADKEFWSGETFRVKMQKTGNYTEIGIGKSLRSALDAYFIANVGIGEFLFYSTTGGITSTGRPVTRQWCWSFFRKWSKKANLQGRFGGTTGRRTCATFVYLTTGRIEDAQVILGHKDSITTMRYIGMLREQAIEAQSSIDL